MSYLRYLVAAVLACGAGVWVGCYATPGPTAGANMGAASPAAAAEP